LAEAFGCSVNDLPVSIVLSWFEQKAVAILLGLFSLGVKDIYIGPKAPEWITPGVFGVLQKHFNLQLISTVQEDLDSILGPDAYKTDNNSEKEKIGFLKKLFSLFTLS